MVSISLNDLNDIQSELDSLLTPHGIINDTCVDDGVWSLCGVIAKANIVRNIEILTKIQNNIWIGNKNSMSIMGSFFRLKPKWETISWYCIIPLRTISLSPRNYYPR